MSWLPKRDKFDPVQASAVDFALAQEGELLHQGRGRDGMDEVKVRGEGEEWRMLPRNSWRMTASKGAAVNANLGQTRFVRCLRHSPECRRHRWPYVI